MRLVKYDGTAVHLREMIDTGWIALNENVSYLFLDGVCYLNVNFSGNMGSKWTILGRVPTSFKKDSKFSLINETGWGKNVYLWVKTTGEVVIGGANETVAVVNNTVTLPMTSF